MAVRNCDTAALPARRPPVAPHHVGGGCGLVQEHDAVRIEVELALEPPLARLHHVWAVLLSRVERPFLRLMPWRLKKRDSPLKLTVAPCSCKVARTSRR